MQKVRKAPMARAVTRPAHALACVIAFVSSTALVGCTVLTKSQVEAVANFAQATKGFGSEPASVIEAHAALRSERGLLVASTFTIPDPALRTIEQSIRQQAALQALAASATTGLGILDDYTQLLTILSSDQFTDELKNNAVQLGASIDSGVAAFNKTLPAGANPVDPFGDIVAGIVRAGGGLLIRHMQEKALQQAVVHADPAIQRITAAVENLMAAYLAPTVPGDVNAPNLFGQESEDIRQAFPRMRRASGAQWDLATLQRVNDALRQSQQGVQLAQSCQASAAAYRAAHAQLRTAMDSEASLAALKGQIEALAAEIKAGKSVRDDIKHARKS